MKALHHILWNRKAGLMAVLLLSVGMLIASPGSNEQARVMARQFFGTLNTAGGPLKAPASGTALQLKYASSEEVPVRVTIFQQGEHAFVVLGATSEGYEVLGYSTEGGFDAANCPPALKALLGGYSGSVMEQPVLVNSSMQAPYAVVGPLLDSVGVKLNQFNHQNAGGCPTGCVATAMAQIMCYYKYPDSGIGSHSYDHPTYGQFSADFANTRYNWANPTDKDYELLSQHVGIAMDMDYCGWEGKGSVPSHAGYHTVLERYFKYYIEDLKNYASDNKMLRSMIDLRNPLYTALPGNPGHAIVLDGYDSNGFFHINFGWGGGNNGYFKLNDGGKINAGYSFGNRTINTLLITPHRRPLHPADSLALKAITSNIEGLNWDVTKPRELSGVTIINGRVVAINILKDLASLKGKIPEEIGNLTQLDGLSISTNLNGTLPASLSKLTNLTYLTLSNSMGTLRDTLPVDIGNLKNLKRLHLVKVLKGQIPESIGELSNLEWLTLRENQLSGSIPASIGNLTNLSAMNLSANGLSGVLPETLGNLNRLEELNLSRNQFSGSLPASLGRLSKLRTLELYENQLSGAVPQSMNGLDSLRVLDLHSNELTGDVPAIFGSMKELYKLDISENKLSSLPDDLGGAGSLLYLYMNTNSIAALPESFYQLSNLKSLKASNNKLTHLPKVLSNLLAIETFDVAFNRLTEFPSEIISDYEKEAIYFNDNLLTRFPYMMPYLKAKALSLQNNDLEGAVPANLLDKSSQTVNLNGNRFTYSDLPKQGDFTRGIFEQKPLRLKTNVVKVRMGDTVRIHIDSLIQKKHPRDSYVWFELSTLASGKPVKKDIQLGPELKLLADEALLTKQYFCRITNDSCPLFTSQVNFTSRFPVIKEVFTDTLHFEAMTREESLQALYPGRPVFETNRLEKKELSDKSVTLIAPYTMRGEKSWQASADSISWIDVSPAMTQNDLKKNVVSAQAAELIIHPVTPAFYRSVVREPNCEPLYSDAIRVNPYGETLCDTVVNVVDDNVTVTLDSLEVVLPKGIHDKDFRLTVVKLDHPPKAPEGTKIGPAYDLTVSFGDVFSLPLIIRFRNLKEKIDSMDIDRYKAAYFDDVQQKWIQYDNSHLSLTDSSLHFMTNHLTILTYTYNESDLILGYTHIHSGKNVNVIYRWVKDAVEDVYCRNYENIVKSKPRDWRTTNTDPDAGGTPIIIQDIVANMDYIIDRFKGLDLKTPWFKFTVYVADYGYSFHGQITSMGKLLPISYYFKFNLKLGSTKDEEFMRSTLAHEYMHFTQDYYMTTELDNLFFTEVHAPLADRMVWPDDKDLANPENELLLKTSLRTLAGSFWDVDFGEYSIFDLLSESWDHDAALPFFEKVSMYPFTLAANVSGSFLHYMRSYRTGSRLNVAQLLIDHGWFNSSSYGTWRGYLNNYTTTYFQKTIGDEFDDYVRFILGGSESKFTALNVNNDDIYSEVRLNAEISGGNGSFTKLINYDFKQDEETEITDMAFKVDYLSAKMVMLRNLSATKHVIINYRPDYKMEAEYKVYHGRYDLKEKKVIFTDISTDKVYDFLLNPKNTKPEFKYQDTQFLLFVNKKCPGVLDFSSTFNPKIEISAYPFNVRDLVYADVSQQPVHTYSNGSKGQFYITGRMNVALTGANQTVAYNDYKVQLSGESQIKVINSFTETLRINNGADLPPSIQIQEKEQELFFDLLKGDVLIQQTTKETNKWGVYFDNKALAEIPEVVWSVVESTKTIRLKDVLLLKPVTISGGVGDVLEFKTTTTEETKKYLVSLSETVEQTNYSKGVVSGTNSYHYVSTDFSGPPVPITIWFRYK